jgi:oxygen-independent coproporphyrinogen III oxidase
MARGESRHVGARGLDIGAGDAETSVRAEEMPRAPGAPLGLYIHIPFCSAICHYCNFNRGLLDDALAARYVQAVERDVLRQGDGARADTVYFGGGTPSLLPPADVARLIQACRRSFALTSDSEITLETNPETVTVARMEAYRAAGVTRLSMGVQSFRDEELKRLGRIHSAARARDAFVQARQAGFDNISLDLMLWLPQQTLADCLASIDAMVEVGPDHASLYLLELYPNAPLREHMARAAWSQAPDDDAAEMYLQGLARLDAAGYQQYEISNVARSGRVSRHNLKYWTNGEWMAFGCGAHGTRRGRRWRVVAGTDEYIQRIEAGAETAVEARMLSKEEQVEEMLFTGIRLTAGLPLAKIRAQYGLDVWARYGRDLERFVAAGVLEYHPPATLRLTREGMLLANEVCSVFV